ncbi:hypothetical protein pclt_cds_12 [Pandoravirus celtis]|uniref:Uncharacterized protein n=1 Tax=Pandoravirus celtis TaxID=2568002 RepID=A0A4D6EGV6_9VIRU|nr:hypothetical protein pclt_cds_12 [Pandoravirus celtis]
MPPSICRRRRRQCPRLPHPTARLASLRRLRTKKTPSKFFSLTPLRGNRSIDRLSLFMSPSAPVCLASSALTSASLPPSRRCRHLRPRSRDGPADGGAGGTVEDDAKAKKRRSVLPIVTNADCHHDDGRRPRRLQKKRDSEGALFARPQTRRRRQRRPHRQRAKKGQRPRRRRRRQGSWELATTLCKNSIQRGRSPHLF